MVSFMESKYSIKGIAYFLETFVMFLNSEVVIEPFVDKNPINFFKKVE